MSKNHSGSLKAMKIVDDIMELSYMEVLDLVEVIKNRTGLQGMMMPVGGGSGANTSLSVVEEEEVVVTEFDVVLEKVPEDKKIAMIKALREVVPGLGIKEAKDMLGELPAKINAAVLNKEDAAALAAKLSPNGTVVIKPA